MGPSKVISASDPLVALAKKPEHAARVQKASQLAQQAGITLTGIVVAKPFKHCFVFKLYFMFYSNI